MSETERVVKLIRDIQCHNLGNWDGCCCSHFSLRNVDVDISCGKGGEQAVKVSSGSMDHCEATLRPILAEVVAQVLEQSGRLPRFAQYINGRRLESEDKKGKRP